MIAPLLSDIPANNQKYEAGDRVLATVTCTLTDEQRQRIVKSVRQFCNADVNLLVVDKSKVRASWKRSDGAVYWLVPLCIPTGEKHKGVANVSCNKIVFEKGDKVHVECSLSLLDEAKESFKRWVGDAAELQVSVNLRMFDEYG